MIPRRPATTGLRLYRGTRFITTLFSADSEHIAIPSLHKRRSRWGQAAQLIFCFLVSFTFFACEDETLSKEPDMPMMAIRCIDDSECGPRERCTSTGLCVSRDECDEDRPCSDPEQVCGDNDGDGYNDCFFERCQERADCIGKVQCDSEALVRCVDGRCLCGEPCQGGCPEGLGCCLPTDMCQMLPPQCGDLTCPRGQFISVTSTGAWDTGQCEVLGETCECVRYPALPIGDIGLYSAMARNSQNTYFSAYNLDYGDLMFGVLLSDGVSIDWEFVDGVPSSTTAVTGDVDGPRGGLSELSHDVGLHTDIEIDALGQPHIAYHDRTHGALKYAIGTPEGWKIHTIDQDGTAGVYADLSFTNDGRPRISYLTLREERNGTRYSSLKFAVSNELAPQVDSAWTIRVVEETSLTRFGCEDRCNLGEVCRASDRSCFVPSPASMCPGGCPDSDQACLEGTCIRTRPFDPVSALPKASGLWPSTDLRADGSAVIVYYDSILGALKMAELTGPNPGVGAVTQTTLDNGMLDDVGRFPSIFITGSGDAHISYLNETQQALVYRHLDATGTTLLTETVERGSGQGNSPNGNLLGADTSLVVDSTGMVRIAYQNATEGTLRYARRQADASWTVITLKGNENPYEGSFGFYVDQVLSETGASPLVSSYRYWLAQPYSNGLVVTPAP